MYQAKAAKRAASSNGLIASPCQEWITEALRSGCEGQANTMPKKKHRLCADSPLPDEADLPPFLCGFGTAFSSFAHPSINHSLFCLDAHRLVLKDSAASTDAGLSSFLASFLRIGPRRVHVMEM
jgi:hypothetical protein